ncbi:MAG: hypothetical protein KAQ87_01010 [Candidatus Pacebacteria bacterium]|nr:hypothetical protein [Candidatus Paceibacterota bacterium]
MIIEGTAQLLSRKGRMTVGELVEEINVFDVDIDQWDVSAAIATLNYKKRVALHSLSSQKYDPDAQRPYYEAIYTICK